MVNWDDAPEGAEYYGRAADRLFDTYFKFEGKYLFWFRDGGWTLFNDAVYYDRSLSQVEKMENRPGLPKRQLAAPTTNKYDRVIHGKHGGGPVTVDVYRVLNAFGPLSPETQHAVKKLLAPGQRGVKDERQDLLEAIQSIEARLRYLEDVGDGD